MLLALAGVSPQSFATGIGPCEQGFIPTCEQAKGFSLCKMEAVMRGCPDTCTTKAVTAGHGLHNENMTMQPTDYTKPLENKAAKSAICGACRANPGMKCCHNHPHGRALHLWRNKNEDCRLGVGI